MGSCPTDATHEGRSRRVVFANLPLCQRPNVCQQLSRHFWPGGNIQILRAWVTINILRLGWFAVKVLKAAPIVEHINEVNSLGRLFRGRVQTKRCGWERKSLYSPAR